MLESQGTAKSATLPRIFVFHSLRPRGFDVSAAPLVRFHDLIELVGEMGLRLGSVSEAARDQQVVAITFDDGYDDLLQLLPTLRQRRFPITVFLPTAYLGKDNSWDNFLNAHRRRHLSEEHLRALSELGVEFGSHSHSHVDLTLLSADEVAVDLTESKGILESLTGKPCRYLAFPFGATDTRVTNAAKEAGFEYALLSTLKSSEPFLLPRIAINRLDSRLTVRAKLQPTIISGAEQIKLKIISGFSHLTPLTRGYRSKSRIR